MYAESLLKATVLSTVTRIAFFKWSFPGSFGAGSSILQPLDDFQIILPVASESSSSNCPSVQFRVSTNGLWTLRKVTSLIKFVALNKFM